MEKPLRRPVECLELGIEVKGEAVYFFAFDVANELLAERAREILGGRCSVYEPRGRHAAPRGGGLHRPLSVTPPDTELSIDNRRLRLEIRLYEFGAVSIIMRSSFESTSLGELINLHDAVAGDGQRLAQIAQSICAELCREIRPALVRPSEISEPEAYTVFCLYEADGVADLEHWLREHRRDVAGLLTARPPNRSSESQVDEVLRQQRSLEKTDLTVIDWDAALVIDLTGHADDVLLVIELANLQLEEFRHMDRSLDRFMNQAYLDLERRSMWRFGASTTMVRKLRWFRIDLAKLADEVTNITKFFGEWHLARIYLAARERFHLDNWRSSVDQRLGQLDQLYNMVRSEIAERRMFILELVIGALILIEFLSSIGLFRR